MFTSLNLFFLLFYSWMPESGKDIMRASSFLILLVIGYTWIVCDMQKVYLDLFNSFFSSSIKPSIKCVIVWVMDMLFHLVPVLIIGLPQRPESILIGLAVLLTWFCYYRDQIHIIYSPLIPANACITVACVIGIGYAVCCT
jgi:hypothetical protein